MAVNNGLAMNLSPPELRLLPGLSSSRRNRLLLPARLFVRARFGESLIASCRLRNIEACFDNVSNGGGILRPVVFKNDDDPEEMPELNFNRLQPTEEECSGLLGRNFGRYVAREAIIDEEIWMAAFLRAASIVESMPDIRDAANYRYKYTEQEFLDLRRRSLGKEHGIKSFCFVAVRKPDRYIRRSVLKSVVGTVELSMPRYLNGAPNRDVLRKGSVGIANQNPFKEHRYAYIGNICVAKSARRQGIASNMIYLAKLVASLEGVKQVFAHVDADDAVARKLHEKCGFQIDAAQLEGRRLLMSAQL